jgi:hypothetical protein
MKACGGFFLAAAQCSVDFFESAFTFEKGCFSDFLQLSVSADIQLNLATERLCVTVFNSYLISDIHHIDLVSPQGKFDLPAVISNCRISNIRRSTGAKINGPYVALFDNFAFNVYSALFAL